jgi:hypothetical protein
MAEAIFGCIALLSWQAVELARGRHRLARAGSDDGAACAPPTSSAARRPAHGKQANIH